MSTCGTVGYINPSDLVVISAEVFFYVAVIFYVADK